MALVQARKAQDFRDSVGVNVHVHYPQYKNKLDAIGTNLNNLGIRFVRDSSLNSAAFQDWYVSHGIKVMYVVMPWVFGIVPNNSYAVSGQGTVLPTKKLLVNHLKELGECVHTVEMTNEIDLGYSNLFWSEADKTRLSDDPSSAYFWGKYLLKITKDSFNAINADPATSHLKIVGGSPGKTYTYSYKNPMLDMSAYLDYACGHYYAPELNGFQNNGAYAGLPNYFAQGYFPGNATGRKLPIPDFTDTSLERAEYPGTNALYRRNSEKPFGSDKPLVISECGFHTSNSDYGITYASHGKLVPRMAAEFFKLGFYQSYFYELVDSGSNGERGSTKEASFGLLENDLSEKPGATQLRVLLNAVRETTQDNRTSIGFLDYTLSLTMPSGYDRKEYVREILLQKQNGDFVLLVYHNVASLDCRQVRPPLAISHPNVNAVLTLPRNYKVKRTTLRTDTIEPTPVITNSTNNYSFQIADTVTILELSIADVPLVSTNINCTSGSTAITQFSASMRNIGVDIWSTSDSFTFAQVADSNVNSSIGARCFVPSNTHMAAKAGVMYREDITPGSQNYCLTVRPDGSLAEQYRSAEGGLTTKLTMVAAGSNNSYYLRINKVGNTYQGQYKVNKNDAWINCSNITMDLGISPLKGTFLTSHSTLESTASFEEIDLG